MIRIDEFSFTLQHKFLDLLPVNTGPHGIPNHRCFSLFAHFRFTTVSGLPFTVKSSRVLSNYLLASYLLVNCIDFGAFLNTSFIYPHYPGVGMLLTSTVTLIMPLLYLFIVSVIYADFRLKQSQLLHGLVFLLYNAILIPNYYLLDRADKLEFINSPEFFSSLEIRFTYILLHAQEIVYLLWSVTAIQRYRKLLLENYANASMMNYRWLLTFVSLVALYIILGLAKNLFLLVGMTNLYGFLLVTSVLAILVCISWVFIRALQNPEFFRGIDSKLQLVRNIAQSDLSSNANSQETISQIEKLKEHMSVEKPYLDATLSLHQLAKLVDMDNHDLSILINHVLNQHFFDFVNSYRIEHAKELLRNPDKKEFTVLEILYEVGFNSKSSFNTAFKKYTAQTPTEYRKSAVI